MALDRTHSHHAEGGREAAVGLCEADYAPALLLQPHGFEGLGSIRELLATSDPAVLERQDVRQLHVDGESASGSVADKAHPQEDLLARVFGLQGFDLEIGISRLPSARPAP